MSQNRLPYPGQHAKHTGCSETPGEKPSKAMSKKASRKCCRTIARYKHSRRNGEKSFRESLEANLHGAYAPPRTSSSTALPVEVDHADALLRCVGNKRCKSFVYPPVPHFGCAKGLTGAVRSMPE